MKHLRPAFLSVIIILSFVSLSRAQTPPKYEISATVDTGEKSLSAVQTVTFTNNSGREIGELLFHIYPNRKYTQAEKTFMQRFAGYFKVEPFPSGFQTGAMDLISVKSGNKALDHFIEGEDETLLRVVLDEVLRPGESVKVAIEFTVDIPHVTLGRFGWNDNVFRLSRWYPILSVYDNEKGWNKSPFYPFHRPFYSEASLYTVQLTVPEDQVLAHSAVETDVRTNADGTKTVTYESNDPIREFSFAMSEYYEVLNENFEGVDLYSYYLPGNENSAAAALASVKDLMSFYTEHFGPYPYRNFSVVPVDLGYGGEQMSNLIFINRFAYQMPGMLNRYFDFLVAHETGHQWFYNVVGIDEYKEMWLEEGVNSYFIEQYLARKYGEDGEVADWPEWFEQFEFLLPKLTFKKTRDTRYKGIARIGYDHAIVSDLSSFSEPSSIFSVTYGKGARVLGMLRYYIGDEVFEKVFKRIYKEYEFKNLSVADLIRITEEESGQELSGFFEPWLYSDKNFNYAVKKGGGNSIVLSNRGGIRIPAEVQVTHRDGSVENFVWKGDPQTEQIHLENPSPVTRVVVDPGEHLLDIDRVNNVWPRKLNFKLVPLYLPLYEIPVFMPEDGYNLTVGPATVDSGFGIKASLQKPYDQSAYTWSSYEFGESLHHTGFGYELKNVLHTHTSAGFEIANTKDYDNGADDLVSGKVFIRRELWPVQYSLPETNDHVSLYLLRNQSIHDRAALANGKENVRNTDYNRSESIVGTALHLNRSGTSPDPSRGYKFDLMLENSGHFLGATQSFNRAGVDTAVYVPVTLGSKVALRAKYGFGHPRDKELFYAGGMEGLRGYELKSVRGSNMLLGSVEYRFPLLQNLDVSFFDSILNLEEVGLVVFGDVGQAWFEKMEHSHLYKDAGMGLRFTFNIGRLFERVVVRLDAAQAINDSQEDEPRFWFGLNHAF